MSRWRAKLPWLGGAALFALAPKCLLCLAAYLGLGTLFGLRLAALELCGTPAGPELGAVVGGVLAPLALASVWLLIRPLARLVASARRPRPRA